MPDYKNPDNIGNHFEVFGYKGWPDAQDEDLGEWNPWEDEERSDNDRI